MSQPTSVTVEVGDFTVEASITADGAWTWRLFVNATRIGAAPLGNSYTTREAAAEAGMHVLVDLLRNAVAALPNLEELLAEEAAELAAAKREN